MPGPYSLTLQCLVPEAKIANALSCLAISASIFPGNIVPPVSCSLTIPGLLDQVPPDSPRFVGTLLTQIHGFGRQFPQRTADDERWSLTDCGLKAPDWKKVLDWAGRCPAADAPRPNSRTAGLLLLLIGAAVARSLDKDEPLWQMVADACSDDLRATLFGHNDYPVGEARDALSDACESLGLRHQLDLPGKHRYWRTVQLQFGFSAKVGAARLSFWLAGYGVPETVKTLLAEGDPNSSQSFRQLWACLKVWSRHPHEMANHDELRCNPWYPAEAHELIKTGLAATRDQVEHASFRIEEEDAVSPLFGPSRFRDGFFQVGLSNSLPKEIEHVPAAVLRVYMEGIGWSRLIRNEEGSRDLEGGSLRVSAWDALQNPTREVSVIGPSGALFREQFEFWSADQDLVLFRGEAGRRIRDLNRFTAECGCSYALVTRSDIQVESNSGPADCADRSKNWSLYQFPRGLPPGFQTTLDNALFWSPGTAKPLIATLPGSFFRIREISPITLHLSVHVPPGWTVEQFRFDGSLFSGDHADMEVSPAIDFSKKAARVVVTRAGERRVIDLPAERIGDRCTGATYQSPDGKWRILLPHCPLDAGQIEGRLVAVHWDERYAEDPWLTLDSQPLLAQPHFTRRQHFLAAGEPLQLRFGLMNEEIPNRIQLASTVYSTGILAEVRETVDLYLLVLREKIEAAPDLCVWVWEAGNSTPRLLPREEVEAHSDNQTISVLQLSAPKPIGWAVSLDGNWRGARFHADPRTKNWPRICDQWREVLAQDEAWGDCAAALRWWRFPVFMEPFLAFVRERASRNPYETLCAWIESPRQAAMAFSRSDAEIYVNPMRTLLWNYSPTPEDCTRLWEAHESSFFTAFEAGQLSLATTLLLISHPVLLAKIICELLWRRQQEDEARVPIVFVQNLFRRVPDPAKIREIEGTYCSFFRIARDFIERLAGYGDPIPGWDRFQTLRAEALSELRSWIDSRPLDDAYFLENIVKPAEALFDQRDCDTTRLKVAVTRSRACCAFIVSHLLKEKGLRDRA